MTSWRCDTRGVSVQRGRIVSTTGLDIDAARVRRALRRGARRRTPTRCTPACEGRRYLTGPLARYSAQRGPLSPLAREAAREAGLGPVCRNPFRSIVVRSVELLYACDEALRSSTRTSSRTTVRRGTPCRRRPGTGAPRRRAAALPPLRLDADGTHPGGADRATDVAEPADHRGGPARRRRRHLDLPDEELRISCEQAVRNHDPCISCATHFLELRWTAHEPGHRPRDRPRQPGCEATLAWSRPHTMGTPRGGCLGWRSWTQISTAPRSWTVRARGASLSSSMPCGSPARPGDIGWLRRRPPGRPRRTTRFPPRAPGSARPPSWRARAATYLNSFRCSQWRPATIQTRRGVVPIRFLFLTRLESLIKSEIRRTGGGRARAQAPARARASGRRTLKRSQGAPHSSVRDQGRSADYCADHKRRRSRELASLLRSRALVREHFWSVVLAAGARPPFGLRHGQRAQTVLVVRRADSSLLE